MSRTLITIMAFVIAPATVPAVFLLIAGILYLADVHSSRWFWFVASWLYPCTLAVSLVIGIPVLFLFRSRGWASARAFAVGGILIGRWRASRFIHCCRLGSIMSRRSVYALPWGCVGLGVLAAVHARSAP